MSKLDRLYPSHRGLHWSTFKSTSFIHKSRNQYTRRIGLGNGKIKVVRGRVKTIRVCAARFEEGDSQGDFQDKDLRRASDYPSQSDISWETAKTVSLIWSIILPIGYGIVPLASKATGSESFSAFAGELLMLTATTFILYQNGYLKTLNANFKDLNAYAAGILAALLALVLNQLIDSTFSSDPSDMQVAIQASTSAQMLMLYLASAILAPLSEELLYRGYLLSSLRLVGMNRMVAVLLSALLFAVAHLQVPAVPQLFLVGLCLGSAVISCNGNVASSFVGHALYNSLLFLNLVLALATQVDM